MKCHKNLENCKNVCEGVENPVILNNDNIVHVHQNISRVGGKYGLGYNNTDPCCILVRKVKNCDLKRFSTAKRCHHKRHRVCGKKCKARVMMSKPVTQCDSNPLMYASNEDYIKENCHETVKYVPYHPHRRQISRTGHRCRSITSWPFVACGQSYESSICRRCQSLTYYHILKRGLPAECSACFRSFTSPNMEMYPLSLSPRYPVGGLHLSDNVYGLEDDFNFELDGWQQEKFKCRLPNGEVSENCERVRDTDDLEFLPSSSPISNPLQDLNEAQDEYMEYNHDDEDYYDDLDFEVEKLRHRRQTFARSQYSQRYRP